MTQKILRLSSIKAITGLSRSSIYLRIAEKRFPKPINLGGRAVGWLEYEIDAWIEKQIYQSRKGVAGGAKIW
jgi:prophage regulatory protein